MDFVAQVERIEAADAIPAFLKGVFITGKSKYQIEDRLADCVKTHNRAFLFHARYGAGTRSLFQKIR